MIPRKKPMRRRKAGKVAATRRRLNLMWYWLARLPERKGQPCRVLVRGAMNSVLVEFEDGYRVVTSRYAVRAA